MAIRGSALIPSAVTKTIICIDQLEGAEYRGVLYTPYMPAPRAFQSVREMIDIMEDFFDEISFPQAFYDLRSFQGARTRAKEKQEAVCSYGDWEDFLQKRGKMVTFLLHVQFRQNATWQGDLTWIEQSQTKAFRSILELLRLMTDAIDEYGQESPFASWKR